ncbi:MAG: hypothetical protein H0T72_08330, partial [Chloroflexia bacterium]|nr:hypothetical protein [Chloroflexia bacterium]
MSSNPRSKLLNTPLSRRNALAAGAGALGAAALGSQVSLAQDGSAQTGVDPDTWTPEYIDSIAGTLEVDTAGDVAQITPLDYAGETSLWYAG